MKLEQIIAIKGIFQCILHLDVVCVCVYSWSSGRGADPLILQKRAASELGAGVPFLENIEEAHVVVLFHVALEARSYLRGAENAPQFFVVNRVAEVRVEPSVERLATLVKREQGYSGSHDLSELLNQLFSVLGNERAYLFILGGVLPLGEVRRLDRQLSISFDNVAEGLLPLMEVK